MKKLIIIVITTIFIFIPQKVNAATNPYGRMQSLYGATTVRCTWYAWDQAYKLGGVALPGWGNAQTWYASAKKAGYKVGTTPQANSIAVYSSNDGYGHVAYVVSVTSDYYVVNEGGALQTETYPCPGDSSQICSKTVPAGDEGIVNNQIVYNYENSSLIGFIYLNEAPKKTNNNSSNNNSTNNSSSNNNKVNVTKSSNNNLEELKIDGIEFEFNKEELEYNVEVPYETKIIKIGAKAEDSKAIVTGTGEKALELGENNYTIIVKAENGKSKEYKIKVVRKEKEIKEDQEIKVSEQPIIKVSKKTNETSLIVGVSVGTIVVLFLIGTIIFKIKKNKKFAVNKKIKQKTIDKISKK